MKVPYLALGWQAAGTRMVAKHSGGQAFVELLDASNFQLLAQAQVHTFYGGPMSGAEWAFEVPYDDNWYIAGTGDGQLQVDQLMLDISAGSVGALGDGVSSGIEGITADPYAGPGSTPPWYGTTAAGDEDPLGPAGDVIDGILGPLGLPGFGNAVPINPPPAPPPPGSWSAGVTDAPDPESPNVGIALFMANLVANVYNGDNKVPPGWWALPSANVTALTGINPDFSNDDPKSGLHFKVFTNGNRYITAFAGAEGGPDNAVVTVQSAGGDTAQYRDALQVVRGLVSAFGADSVAVTGHSLGGGEAAAAALANGTTAITFEAQGLSRGYLESIGLDRDTAFDQAAAGQIQHYFINGEFATLLQRQIPFVNGLPNAPGVNYRLPWINDVGQAEWAGPPGDAHMIDNVVKSLGVAKPQLVFTEPIPGEEATERVVETFSPPVKLIASWVLNGMMNAPGPPEGG